MSRVTIPIACALAVCSPNAAAFAEPVSALIRLPSGITLHYAVQGRADGEPIVLLHGIGDSWHSFELVLPHIPDRYRVYSVTLRGHGWSDAPASGYRQQDFAADVVAFLDTLDLRQVTLVGHSLGSFIAQAVAVQDSTRLARLVLVGSGPGGVANARTRAETQVYFKGFPTPMDRAIARDFQTSTIQRAVPAPFLETMFEQIMIAAPQMWQQAADSLHREDTAAGLRRLKLPSLLLWGDKDPMLLRADQDALLAALPNARLVVFPGTAHAPHWEEPERLASELLAFMESRVTQAAPAR